MEQVNQLGRIYRTQMGDAEFRRLSAFISAELGIKMPEVKKVMLQSRLQKRLAELQKNSFTEYIDFVFGNEGGEEMINMLDIVTTNKTDFFRESGHFEYMAETALPLYIDSGHRRPLKIWSAGCSSGEEPYTLAIVLSEFKKNFPDFDFQITGTDISQRMLMKAFTGIYSDERVANMDTGLKEKYFLKSKDTLKKTVRVVPELRSKVHFQKLNFMDDVYPQEYEFDMIFCRNVLIYFDRATQENVIWKLCSKLKSGGFFFIGHSESISNFNVPLRQLKSTIFIKT